MQIYINQKVSIYKIYEIMLFQKVRVAIFLLKHEIDLLSLIYCGKEFQIEAPSYIKLFRLHIVRI
jgi:hypothetical protein